MSSGLLQDKSIVVIGGTTGLGLSAALAFVREGAFVVAVGRHETSCAAAERALGDVGAVMQGDACESETANQAIALAIQKFHRFDGLYHVAGGSGRRFGDGPLHELTNEGWTQTFDLNLNSLFYSNRAAVQQFLKQGSGGAVLNMGSVLGSSPSPKYFSTHAYAAAKSAVIGLTRSSAAFYAPQNIRFNVLAPALIETPMSRRAVANDEIMDFTKRKQPLDGGRIGRPDDLDGAAVFLMSDQSKFTTGQVLSVDGGWSVTEAS